LNCNAHFPVGLDAQWQPPSEAVLQQPPLASWLLHTGSLTERVQSLCTHFRLQRLGQATTPLHAAERDWLGAHANAAEVREVILWADEQPWVFARSVLPTALVRTLLADLGDQPLGSLLFNNSAFERGAFELCQWPLAAMQALFPALSGPASLWGRRSRFTYQGMPMIVAELFLPASPLYSEE